LGFEHISVGDILRDEKDSPSSKYASFIGDSMTHSVIIPAQLTIALLKNRMDNATADGKNMFLIDGFPRSMDQALAFEEEVGYHSFREGFC
jgi:UMP-CMP kinase